MGGSGFTAAAVSLGREAFSRNQRDTQRHNSSREGDVSCLGDNLGTGQEVQCPYHNPCCCIHGWGVCG